MIEAKGNGDGREASPPAVERAFAAAARPIERARHVPGEIYRSPEIFERERERLFFRDWLCVGRVEEIERPGDYMAMRIVREPVLLTRGTDGAINAFSNICLHRGVEIAEGSGNRESFRCPYHGWTYDLDGRLRGASFMKERPEFDVSACRLRTIRVDTWKGWIFVTFSADAPPLARFLAHFDRAFDYLHMERCRLGNRIDVDIACNWKLVAENLVDIYHVHVLHSKSFGKGRVPVDYLEGKDDLIGFYEAPPMVPEGKSRFGNMPWLADKPFNYASMGHLDPNMQLFSRSDAVHNVVMWPLDPEHTRIVVYSLFPAEHLERPGFEADAAAYGDYWRLVVEEDKTMIHSLQNVMSSRRFEPGPMSQMEHGVHTLINRYLARVFSAA